MTQIEKPWHRRFTDRLRAHWRLKLNATVVMALGFFPCYFALLYLPVFPVTEVPITAIDRVIGFWSTSLLAYITLWVYIPLSSWLLNSRKELIVYSAFLGGLGFLGLAVFFFFPTSVPRPDIDTTEYPSFRFLVAIDEPRNVFPCLHAAFAVFSAVGIGRVLRQMGAPGVVRVLNWCWCLAILYSAVATKQHMAIDLLAGTLMGAGGAGLHAQFISWCRRGAIDRPYLGRGRSTPAVTYADFRLPRMPPRAVHEAASGGRASPAPQRNDPVRHAQQE